MMSPFVDSLALAIKYHRNQAGLTQAQLAQFAGVGKTAVYDIEHKKATVQLATILKILEVLNIQLLVDAPLEYEGSTHEKS